MKTRALTVALLLLASAPLGGQERGSLPDTSVTAACPERPCGEDRPAEWQTAWTVGLTRYHAVGEGLSAVLVRMTLVGAADPGLELTLASAPVTLRYGHLSLGFDLDALPRFSTDGPFLLPTGGGSLAAVVSSGYAISPGLNAGFVAGVPLDDSSWIRLDVRARVYAHLPGLAWSAGVGIMGL